MWVKANSKVSTDLAHVLEHTIKFASCNKMCLIKEEDMSAQCAILTAALRHVHEKVLKKQTTGMRLWSMASTY